MTDITDNLVSTIIPVYNRPDMLRSAVQSVLDQSYRPVEVVIVDDGSTDTTPQVAQELVDTHPDIIRFVQKENAGPGPAREAGRQLARGNFIQYLDSDDRLLPGKFTDQVNALNRHPECGIAYGITRLIRQNGETIAEPFKWTDQQRAHLFPGLLVDRWWCTHTPLYRRSVTDRIGPWCDMRWSQDWEYDARAGAMNVKLIHCDSVVSEHVHHDGERQTSIASWTTDPERLRNRHRLLTALWQTAQEAGVCDSAPERQHFARWCFTIARQCSAQGLTGESGECLSMAESAAGTGRGVRGVAIFRWMTGICGHRAAGRMARWVESRRHSAGTETMKQSFSGQAARNKQTPSSEHQI